MPPEIIVALCSLAGTLAGSVGGIVVSNRLVNWRIEQLEKKMDRHNGLMERVYALEAGQKAVWRQVDDHKTRIHELEGV